MKKFISVEGIDGAGKAEKALWLSSFLQEKGYRTVVVQELVDTGVLKSITPEECAQKQIFGSLQQLYRELQHTVAASYSEADFVITDCSFFTLFAYAAAYANDAERAAVKGWIRIVRGAETFPNLAIFLDESPFTVFDKQAAKAAPEGDESFILSRECLAYYNFIDLFQKFSDRIMIYNDRLGQNLVQNL